MVSARGEVTSRSGFERSLMERLDAKGITYGYETTTYPIVLEQAGYCRDCGSRRVSRNSRYTPDFFFPVWVVEAKGKFTGRDRKRVLALASSRPDMRFAMVFQRDNKLSKSSNTRYTKWCLDKGIPCSVGWFRDEWMH